MSKMLASVNSLSEARQVFAAGADIIDLKQPQQGALGALPVAVVSDIVAELKPNACISATIGDLPLQPQLVVDAVQAMAATGVDFVKIGIFPEGDPLATLQALSPISQQGIKLIAVLFADTRPDLALITAIRQAGFAGAMLDTMDKRLGSLTRLMEIEQLQDFVSHCRASALLSGLAGSLRADDIGLLLPLQADYLGFRGALCRQHCRTDQLDDLQVRHIRELIEA